MITSPETRTNEWPWLQLRSCLRFLALDAAAKLRYLPGRFPETNFHMDEGDLQTTEPLKLVAFVAHDACGACVVAADGDEPWLSIVRELRSVLALLLTTDHAPVWDLASYRDHSSMAWGAIWEAVARLTLLALQELSWTAGVPDIPCVTLLDEYSNGAYSAHFTKDRSA